MQEHKKMTMMQLTVVVAVNMMGSGIIMLPTNMAKVGAISLLSWIVTAIGSMAIAYGFAQAGLFNQRPGGMAAYSEDAYGKGGYFLTFLLYFFSLAIGNVAIAISAVGYLAGFFPGMSATPIATCISVIVLVWLTTVANFGGPSITGKIGAITVWGVIIPVAGLSVIGWFWFKGDTFMQAWNPKGLSLFEGMGSSIALTLWAFLGMESAAQNSDAVENPKRDVPLACMLGTLGAAVIYVLSTTVIQGIVPNADLAKSTGPFALAYAQMFNPTIGSIIMALAVLACLGSLLGWQFTIAQTAKTAAGDRLFPTLFAKVNNKGAPLAGMIVMAIVQSVLALSTISPTLSEQFSALVNLAVVTNVIPYIISLSALFVMMKVAGVSEAVYKRNGWIVAIAMLYSTYAIYASGKDAVLGGTIVLALTYVLYGFLAPRFVGGSTAAGRPAGAAGAAIAAIAVAFLATFAPPPAEAGTLDRVRQANKLTLGYRADARPFSYRDESGNAAGYSVELCQKVAAQVKAGLSMSSLAVEWVPVTLESRFRDVQQGKVDLLCGADSVTLSRRKEVAFSIPIFPGGIGALLRRDAPLGLRDVLNEGTAAPRPFWRGSPAAILTEKIFGVIPKTTTENWAVKKLAELKITARLVGVDTYAAGVQQVTDRGVDAFFGDRPILLDAAKRSPSGSDLIVLDRRFTYEPIALGLQRDDDDFRLLVDRTLSELFRLHEFRDLYAKWFGEPDQSALVFFGLSALPE